MGEIWINENHCISETFIGRPCARQHGAEREPGPASHSAGTSLPHSCPWFSCPAELNSGPRNSLFAVGDVALDPEIHRVKSG